MKNAQKLYKESAISEYIHETRGDTKAYGYEMVTGQHKELSKVLNNVSGKVVIFNYECDLMNALYPFPK